MRKKPHLKLFISKEKRPLKAQQRNMKITDTV